MKKLMLILTAGCISISALSQTSVIGDNKPIRDIKTGNLNGKTFKITFGDQTISQNTQGTNDRWRENANDAAIKNDMNSDNTIDHGVNNQSGNRNDQQYRQGMDKESMNNNNTGTMNTQSNNTVYDQNRDMQGTVNNNDRTMNDQNRMNSQTDYSAYQQDLKGKTAEITFTDTQMESTMLSDNNYKSCPYTVSASSDNMVSFYSNCRNDARVNSQFAGIVEGKLISGSMTYAMPDGKIIKYDFKGSAINPKKKKSENTSGINE